MEQRIRNLENFALIAVELARELEESQQRLEESQRRLEESQQRRGELLQQLLQAVAVIQAEIVRIDETHS